MKKSFTLLLAVCSWVMSSAQIELLKDINSAPSPNSTSFPNDLVEVNNQLFFSAQSNEGRELWKSDGTPEGTMLVKDINPGTNHSSPGLLTNIGGVLYFIANDGVHGAELWKSDGSVGGTAMVEDIVPGLNDSGITGLTDVNGTLFFAAFNPTTGRELWRSDGTEGGTYLIKDIYPGTNSSDPRFFTNINGVVFFVAVNFTNGLELWKTDGTEHGTVLIMDINPGGGPSSPENLTNLNGLLLFTASAPGSGAALWATDGFEESTFMVADINPTGLSMSASNFTVFNGQVYFSASDGEHGSELWRTDGTALGTMMLMDITPGVLGSALANFTVVNETLFFSASDGTTGRELWKYLKHEGQDIVAMVMDIRAGSVSSNLNSFESVNGTLFFIADDGTHGNELWRSDGSAGNTMMVKDILPGATISNPQDPTNVNGTLFFVATDGVFGFELWRSDGTADGTIMVEDILSATQSSNPTDFFDADGALYFRANDGISGNELWKSDGTGVGTVRVADINAGSGNSNPINFTTFNGSVFFTANTPEHGTELWKTDGSQGGTLLVKDIRAGTSSSAPSLLTVVGNTLFFRANDGINGTELWKTDGTSAGTVLVKNINGTSSNSDPNLLIDVNGTLFFIAPTTPLANTELWKSDGTPEGTMMVKDINPGGVGSGVSNLTELGGMLYFSASNGTNGTELWRSDGTSDGTFMVKDTPGSLLPSNITKVNGMLFFLGHDASTGQELWKSDGTSEGTTLVSDIVPGTQGSIPVLLTAVGGTLFFRATVPEFGSELWKSDGTADGTVLVKDIAPGSNSPAIGLIHDVSGKAYFLAQNGAYMALWKSDGTESGTLSVSDNPFSLQSFRPVGSHYFFTATEPATGVELYSMPASTELPGDNRLSQTISFLPLPQIMVTEGSFELTATSSSGLAVSYSISNPLVANLSGNSVELLHGGTTIITASQAGNEEFLPAEDVQQVLVVASITIPSLAELFCAGAVRNIFFSVTGTFGSQNVFTAELSDTLGQFNAARVIGSIAWSNEASGSQNGGMQITIPADAVDGENYRLRLVSTHPAGLGTPHPASFIIDTGPEITSLVITPEPTPIGTAVSLTAVSDDRNVAGIVTTWGDGLTSLSTFNGSSWTDSHVYAAAGVYTVNVRMFDRCGFSTSIVHEYVVIYNPDGGYVAGNGKIDSPPGAYTPAPDLSGNASFGFASEYKNGNSIPEGKTNFRFKAADLDFESTTYEWMVIAGHKAMYKGSGILNDVPDHKFLISAVDGEQQSDSSPDRFRIKIWDASGVVVYDNQSGSPDDAEATTIIQSGSIKIVGKKSDSNSTLRTGIESNLVQQEPATTVYPNPFSNQLTLYYAATEKSDVKLQLTDVTGALAYLAFHAVAADGIYHINLRESGRANGIYFLQVTQGTKTEYIKVLRQP